MKYSKGFKSSIVRRVVEDVDFFPRY